MYVQDFITRLGLAVPTESTSTLIILCKRVYNAWLSCSLGPVCLINHYVLSRVTLARFELDLGQTLAQILPSIENLFMELLHGIVQG